MPSFVLNCQLLLIGTRRSNELTLKAVDSRVDEEINSWDILTIASSLGSWKRTAVLISIFPSIKERNRTVQVHTKKGVSRVRLEWTGTTIDDEDQI